MISNLVYIPYHDWRKISKEGNRTRDAHFIEKFRKNDKINNLLILNRPITYAELLFKKKEITSKIKGDIVFTSGYGSLYKIDNKTYIIDFFVNQNLKHIIKSRVWYFEAYGNPKYIEFFDKCLEYLNIDNVSVITANIFSQKFISNMNCSGIIFDAWDNFYLMPGLNKIKHYIFKAYKLISEKTDIWVTNSKENELYYKKHFKVKYIKIIKNGVDFDRFSKGLQVPKDLAVIKDKNIPIVGFGGKITHLFDTDLFNYLTKENDNFNFIIVGQILDKKTFSKIEFLDNVYYLGDKKYDEYPNYVSNFDIGIIPYKTGRNQHGGDSIKVYEYLSAGLIVVGTYGNGLEDLEEYVHLVDSEESFSESIKNGKHLKTLPIGIHSWEKKEKDLLSLLNKIS